MATSIVLGDGPLGQAVATALRGRDETVRGLGRPPGGHHCTVILGAAVVVPGSWPPGGAWAEARGPAIATALIVKQRDPEPTRGSPSRMPSAEG